jgi:hypothetical protein
MTAFSQLTVFIRDSRLLFDRKKQQQQQQQQQQL